MTAQELTAIADDLIRVKRFYCTFGCGHPNANCYHVVAAFDVDEAQRIMTERFGQKWSMIYESAEAAGVERFGLKEIV